MARKAISDKPRLIDLHKVGLPWAVASLQKREIARMERFLRNAEAAGHGAETASIVRQSIKAAIGSEQFRHFIETTEAQDGYQWPVATIAAATLRKMGLPDDARVLRLRSDGVAKKKHRDRYMTFGDEEWSIIQEVIDAGEATPVRDGHGTVWHQASDGRWWLVFIGHGDNGTFLETAFPAERGMNYINEQLPRWKEYAVKKEVEAAGPEDPIPHGT